MKSMKIKIATALVILIAFFGTSSYAANKPGVDQVRENIASHISYPAFAKENSIQGNVKVIFGLDNESKLIVYSSTSRNMELADYVSENISSLEVKDLEIGKLYSIVITFSLK